MALLSMQGFMTLLVALLAIKNSKGAIYWQIGEDFGHIKPGLRGTYNSKTKMFDFNQPLTRKEYRRILHAVRKRIKRANKQANSRKTALTTKINELLCNLSWKSINEYSMITIRTSANKMQITKHTCGYCQDGHCESLCNMFASEDSDGYCDRCGCCMVLAVRPNYRILRLVSRTWTRELAIKTRQKELRQLTSLADTMHSLHCQGGDGIDLYLRVYQTIGQRVDYIVCLIKIINESHWTGYNKEHPLNEIVAFYIKLVDKELPSYDVNTQRQILLPLCSDEMANPEKTIYSTFRYLFTTVHINNEAPNIPNIIGRCSFWRMSIPCENCWAFWLNNSICIFKASQLPCPRNSGSAQKRYPTLCYCYETEPRDGAVPCRNWTYTPPSTLSYSGDSDGDEDVEMW